MDDGEEMVGALIGAAPVVAGLTIAPHQREAVRVHLEAARRLAALLEAVKLAPAIENAPVFRP